MKLLIVILGVCAASLLAVLTLPEHPVVRQTIQAEPGPTVLERELAAAKARIKADRDAGVYRNPDGTLRTDAPWNKGGGGNRGYRSPALQVVNAAASTSTTPECEAYQGLIQARRQLYCHVDSSIRDCQILIYHTVELKKAMRKRGVDYRGC